ncbi:MAG: ribosomal RNA small subunit methyltransferase A, partial [Alphaproteobacteria bacterium]|nr:ribosomal RNA small subunit methyltransferase A [Alphaproteobacteria bacterium]
ITSELSAKDIFNKYYSETKKRFGQNFLFNSSLNKKIVSLAGSLDSKIIAEIGPGPGGLTLEILKQNIKKLYILEYDKHWITVWKELQPLFNNKLEIIECDALKFDISAISPQIIISNLPYNISTQLLFKWLPNFKLFDKLILMFQKEVAERICAKNKTKAYGKLSVLAQWKSSATKKFDLEPGCFTPPPKIKSSVVEFIPYSEKIYDPKIDFQLFSNFLTNIFAHRRKIVIKPMRKYFEQPENIIKQLGYNETTRAEDISVSDYIKIFNSISC